MFLGLDLGTTALKGLVCDDAQTPLATFRTGYPTDIPRSGRAEQDPDAWIAAAREVVGRLRGAVPGLDRKLQGIGLSGQMHSLVALGADDRPLRPAILWNDTRGAHFVERSDAALPGLAAATGVAAMTSFTAAKLAWLAEAEPQTLARLRRLVLPKDYLRLWLTGAWATDASDAAGTQLFDQAARDWWPKVVAHLGIDPAVLPPVREGTATAGTLRPDVAEMLGLPQVPVVCGGGDAATGALGVGCVDERQALISLGTGASYLVGERRYAVPADPAIHHFAHCIPGVWYRMAAILSSGSALDRMAELLGQASGREALAHVDSAEWTAPPGVMVLPFFDGVRRPDGGGDVRAAIVGLDRATDPADLVRATVEGICFTLADADSMLRAAGPVPDVPMVIGGGAGSPTLLRVLASTLGRPLAVVRDAEAGSALGAVRLALLGRGATLAEVATPPPTREVGPDPALTGACADRLAAFRALYPTLAAYARGDLAQGTGGSPAAMARGTA
jgi:xylulokinase